MTKELLNEVTFTIGLVDRLLHKKQEGEALKVCNCWVFVWIKYLYYIILGAGNSHYDAAQNS